MTNKNALRQISFRGASAPARAHARAHHIRWTIFCFFLSATEHRFDDEIHLGLSIALAGWGSVSVWVWLSAAPVSSTMTVVVRCKWTRVQEIVLQIQRYDVDEADADGCRLSPVCRVFHSTVYTMCMTLFDFIFKFSLSILLSPLSIGQNCHRHRHRFNGIMLSKLSNEPTSKSDNRRRVDNLDRSFFIPFDATRWLQCTHESY